MTAPAPASRSQLRPDGVRLSWHRHGPSEVSAAAAVPLLLLHGLASNASRFEEFCERSRLGHRRALLRLDLRGHGGAITRTPIYTRTWCDDLAAVLDAESAARAWVIGHSLGAQVALHLAQRHPGRVAGLVLIDPVFRAALHGRARRIAQAGPRVRIDTIDCHHWPLTECPAEVRQAIQTWVEDQDPRPSS